MKARFIDVGGIRTRYFSEGTGEPVVLIHGGNLGARNGCIDATNWSMNWKRLAARFHVIAFDRLGQGLTDVPDDDTGFTMKASVDHALATLDGLDIRRAHLVGHSRGGYVAASMAMQRRALPASCTIVSSGTLAPGTDDNHFALSAAPRPYLSRASQQWVFERSSYNEGVVTHAWLDEAVAVAGTLKNIEALRRMEQGLFETVFQPQLAIDKAVLLQRLQHEGMPCPTRVLWGRNDPLAGVRNGIALFRAIGHAQGDTAFTVINRAGHFVFRERPDAFNQCIEQFILACPAGLSPGNGPEQPE